jgi:hypothetical protein
MFLQKFKKRGSLFSTLFSSALSLAMKPLNEINPDSIEITYGRHPLG